MKIIKQQASWLPRPSLFCKQMAVSLLSYITLPFFHETENGTKLFFEKNYYNKKDELVFDGSNGSYFDKLIALISKDYRDLILDLGCGKDAAFYSWAINKGISFRTYIGIDFSVKNIFIDERAEIANDNLIVFDKYRKNSESAMIVLSNSLCYLSNREFLKVLKCIRQGDEIVIIDPEPNLFWDAHFCGIKPVYRKHEEITELLRSNGFTVEGITTDYFLKRLFRMSYALYGIK